MEGKHNKVKLKRRQVVRSIIIGLVLALVVYIVIFTNWAYPDAFSNILGGDVEFWVKSHNFLRWSLMVLILVSTLFWLTHRLPLPIYQRPLQVSQWHILLLPVLGSLSLLAEQVYVDLLGYVWVVVVANALLSLLGLSQIAMLVISYFYRMADEESINRQEDDKTPENQ